MPHATGRLEPSERSPPSSPPLDRFEHSRAGALLAAVLHERGAVDSLFAVLEHCHTDSDRCGREGTLWVLAAISHLFGGRALQLHRIPADAHTPYDEALVAALADESVTCVVLALCALRAAAADSLTVRSP